MAKDTAVPESVEIARDGADVVVDARPARLVSQLRRGDGREVTAHSSGGGSAHDVLPEGVRRATYRLTDEMSVEATPVAEFIAMVEDGGKAVVLALGGEVTVVPSGADRFALAPDEALVVPAGGGQPRVVSTGDLSQADEAEIAAVLDAAAGAVLAAPAADVAATEAAATTAAEPAEAPGEEEPGEKEPAAPETAAAVEEPAPGKAAAKKAAAARAAGAAAGGAARKGGKAPQPRKASTAPVAGKKGKKGKAARPQTTGPVGKKAPAPTKPASTKKPAAFAAVTHGDDAHGAPVGNEVEYEETPRDRRFVIGAVLIGLVAAVIAILVLTQVNEPKTTTVADTATTTTAKPTTTLAPTTTAQPTTTSLATTTTAKATTTTAAPATTAVPASTYDFQPKSCVQQGNTITYTASITNTSTVAYDYAVKVEFRNGTGTPVATADGTASGVAPNKTAAIQATGRSATNLENSGASCVVQSVNATPSK